MQSGGGLSKKIIGSSQQKIVKMRVNPKVLLNSIILISCIFGTLALIIAILAGGDIAKAISAILLFLLGWTGAKFHNSL
jgi:preprotein translocase subunit SecG